MEAKDYLKDIKDIKELMAQSTQFLSLSGLSGILAGVYALLGAVSAHYLIEKDSSYYITLESSTFTNIVVIAFLTLLFSVVTAYLLTLKKARKRNEKIWNSVSKKLLLNFCIPLFTGGIFSILLLKNGYFGLIAPITLIFYGLACVNASKYTLRDVRYLGITLVILGLIATEFSGYGLYFWALGFGVCHIIYGAMMYFKYEKE